MREIKYQVWDGKRMITRTLSHPNLREYTGLKDKNGKEIYEGDVVLNNGSTSQMKEKEIVILQEGGFYPFAIPGWECTIDVEKCEIIGNIYEDKELLK